jgi:hypothetical protein
MFQRSLLVSLAAAAALASSALAGGHATIRVVALPDAVVADRAFDLEFDILHNGQEPMLRLTPVVVATSGSKSIRLPAMETKRAGRYAAAVKLPRQGTWQLVIESNFCGNRLVLEPTKVAPARMAAR